MGLTRAYGAVIRTRVAVERRRKNDDDKATFVFSFYRVGSSITDELMEKSRAVRPL